MEKTFHTPQGKITKTLTNTEILQLAKDGDTQAKIEILKQRWSSLNDSQKINLLMKFIVSEIA